MERLPYWVKRTHWKVTYVAIRLFEEYAARWGQPSLDVMTPARLDILHVIDQRLAWAKRAPGHRPQMALSEIVRKLGLHPSTISKCVARMAELGLVTRSRNDNDLRRTIVTVTSFGLQGIAATFRLIETLQQQLRDVSSLLGTRAASLGQRACQAARVYGSRAVDLWAANYVDTG